jgi:hypothetical protein
VGESFSMYGRPRNSQEAEAENRKRRRNLNDLQVDMRIILNGMDSKI